MKLSIITINLNNREGLQRTIDSVIGQTFRDFEWIVIDGQQRLTTIYLILKALENEKCPSIEYERESYIEVCDSSDEIEKDNINKPEIVGMD